MPHRIVGYGRCRHEAVAVDPSNYYAYLTEDRKGDGLFLDMSCQDNTNTGVLRRDAKWGIVLDLNKAGMTAYYAVDNIRENLQTLLLRLREVAEQGSAAKPEGTP